MATLGCYLGGLLAGAPSIRSVRARPLRRPVRGLPAGAGGGGDIADSTGARAASDAPAIYVYRASAGHMLSRRLIFAAAADLRGGALVVIRGAPGRRVPGGAGARR